MASWTVVLILTDCTGKVPVLMYYQPKDGGIKLIGDKCHDGRVEQCRRGIKSSKLHGTRYELLLITHRRGALKPDGTLIVEVGLSP